VINQTTRFGAAKDEVYVGMVEDVPYLYFAGSDVSAKTPSELRDTALEWRDSTRIVLSKENSLAGFESEVRASLPPTHRGRVVLVGFGRGAYTMSAFCKKMSARPLAVVYLGAPGSVFDCTQKCRYVYHFRHALDPVPKVQGLTTRVVTTADRLWTDLKGMTTEQTIKTVHTTYSKWTADYAEARQAFLDLPFVT
jgi:glycerate-2-kinase